MKTNTPSTDLDSEHLLALLEKRFLDNPERHRDIEWEQVANRLNAKPSSLQALLAMEKSGGQPDVVGWAEGGQALLFFDCATESPAARRSACYDQEALLARKKNRPGHSALAWAAELGITLLDEKDYQFLQSLGQFDLKTSTWLLTPKGIRDQGGAIFGDRRFGRVFIYHNGASSYYAARGFRGKLVV